MHSQLTDVIAVQRIEQLQRAAAGRAATRRRDVNLKPARMLGESVTLRLARLEDGRRLAVLAELDSTRPPTGPILLAEVEDQLVAAIGLEQERVIADPFRPTSEVVTLLRERARQLSSEARSGTWRRRWAGPRARAWASR